jgi:hypothetical protein
MIWHLGYLLIYLLSQCVKLFQHHLLRSQSFFHCFRVYVKINGYICVGLFLIFKFSSIDLIRLSLQWFGYKMSQKDPVLKAWFLAGDTIEKWLHHVLSSFINGWTHCDIPLVAQANTFTLFSILGIRHSFSP